MNVLVVDDSGFMRRRVVKIVASAGHQVEPAKDGADALEVCARWLPELIVTDLLMPEVDGFDLIAALKQPGSPYREIPVIVLSADIQETSRERALELGAATFLNKPPRVHDLIGAIAEHIPAIPTLPPGVSAEEGIEEEAAQ